MLQFYLNKGIIVQGLQGDEDEGGGGDGGDEGKEKRIWRGEGEDGGGEGGVMERKGWRILRRECISFVFKKVKKKKIIKTLFMEINGREEKF